MKDIRGKLRRAFLVAMAAGGIGFAGHGIDKELMHRPATPSAEVQACIQNTNTCSEKSSKEAIDILKDRNENTQGWGESMLGVVMILTSIASVEEKKRPKKDGPSL